MTRTRTVALLTATVAAMAFLSACGTQGNSTGGTQSGEVVATELSTSEAAPAEDAGTEVEENSDEGAGDGTSPAQSVIMPDVVCMNLQAAQNKIQEEGVFFSRSDDATGEGRMQVIDANWIVVGQTPAAGTPVSEAEAVLSVVKLDEPNNC